MRAILPARRLRAPLAALCAMLAAPAHAAGGAHVVDDADVETPGHCHLESWLAIGGGRSGDGFLVPACTPAQLPFLELGAFYDRTYGPGATNTAGLAAKINVQSSTRGVGLAVSPNVSVDTRTGKVIAAGLLVPAGIVASDAVHVNANVAALWTRGDRVRAFAGLQAMIALAPDVQAMAETFARFGQKPGQQAGLRWTVDRGRIDLDVLAARNLDTRSAHTITIGLTIRR